MIRNTHMPPLPVDLDSIFRGYGSYSSDAEKAVALLITHKCWIAAHGGARAVVDEAVLEAMCPLDRRTGQGWHNVLGSYFWYFRDRFEVFSPYVQEIIGRPQPRRPIPQDMKTHAWEMVRRGGFNGVDLHVCHFCDDEITRDACHFDHLTPVSRGGMNHWNNIVATCPTCNLSKGARTEMEFKKLRLEVLP